MIDKLNVFVWSSALCWLTSWPTTSKRTTVHLTLTTSSSWRHEVMILFLGKNVIILLFANSVVFFHNIRFHGCLCRKSFWSHLSWYSTKAQGSVMDDMSTVRMCAVLSSAQIDSGNKQEVLWYNRYLEVTMLFWCYIYEIWVCKCDANSDISKVTTYVNMSNAVKQMPEGSQ